MLVLNPTPADQLMDDRGVPYFLRALGMPLETLLRGLRDPKKRADHVRILLMSARPDDIFFYFLRVHEVIALWPEVEVHVEEPRWSFWNWLVGEWEFWDADWEADRDSTQVTGRDNLRRWILSAESAPARTGSHEVSVESFPADSLQDWLVRTFCAFYEGFDVQLLADLKVLFDGGGELTKALMEIPCWIGDFSPLLLAWRLHNKDLPSVGLQLDLKANDVQRLDRFKEQLVKQILHLCRQELLARATS